MRTAYALLALSLIANVLLTASFSYYAESYASLLTWACNEASLGGWECGEE